MVTNSVVNPVLTTLIGLFAAGAVALYQASPLMGILSGVVALACSVAYELLP